jgi:type I restriction enzyme S subunit
MSDVPNGKALAKCFLVDENDKYTLNQRICSLKPFEMDSKFLYYYLNRNSYYLGFDNGSGQTNLRKNEVLECPVVTPAIDEQLRITGIISTIDSKLNLERQNLTQLVNLKKGLMQVLLTGKVRVKVDEQEAVNT